MMYTTIEHTSLSLQSTVPPTTVLQHYSNVTNQSTSTVQKKGHSTRTKIPKLEIEAITLNIIVLYNRRRVVVCPIFSTHQPTHSVVRF
jgi:hypothetical protein